VLLDNSPTRHLTDIIQNRCQMVAWYSAHNWVITCHRKGCD